MGHPVKTSPLSRHGQKKHVFYVWTVKLLETCRIGDLSRCPTRARRGHEAEVELHKAQKDALKADMAKAAKGKGNGNRDLKSEFVALQSPKPPIWRRYRTNNATIEKLDELMAENPRGILYFCDELIGFLVTLDREDRKGDRAFHLHAWNGNGSNITDRIGRGLLTRQISASRSLAGSSPPSSSVICRRLSKTSRMTA